MLAIRRAEGYAAESEPSHTLTFSLGPWVRRPGAPDGTAFVRPVIYARKDSLRTGWVEVEWDEWRDGEPLMVWRWRIYVADRHGQARLVASGEADTLRAAMRQAKGAAVAPYGWWLA